MVQSVAKALSLLTCFVDEPGGLTLTELARRSETNISTALRLLRTLCSMSLLRRDPVSELFFPGSALVRLARSALLQNGFMEAMAVLQNLAEQTRETASIGIRANDCVLTILTAPSPEALRVHSSVGSRTPLELSAMGRILLAFSGYQELKSLRSPPRLTEFTIISAVKLRNEILATQYRQYAVLDQEVSLGVRAIAAPILGRQHIVQAAVGIEGPVARLADHRIEKLAQAVISAGALLRELPVYDS